MGTLRSNGGIGLAAASNDAALLRELSVASASLAPMDSAVAGRVFATESIGTTEMETIDRSRGLVESMLSSVLSKLNIKKDSAVLAAESAAVQSAFAVASARQHVGRGSSIQHLSGSMDGVEVFANTAEGVANYSGKRSPRIVAAVEAFDNRDQRQSSLYTMAYNYSVPLQSEFGEILYPLLTLPADQVGFGVVVNRLTIHRGMTHSITGRAQELQKIDLTRAPVDHTVLSRNKTLAVPFVRAGAEDNFVDAALIAPRTYDVEGIVGQTAPLKVGVESNLISLSQTDAQLATGAANQTDTLEPAVSLDNLYVKIGDNLIKVNVYGRHGANFVFNQQGRPEDRRLNFRSKYVVLNKDTVQVDGSALVGDLADLKNDNLALVLDLAVDGTVNVEFGNIQVHGPRMATVRVLGSDMKPLAANNAQAQALSAAVVAGSIVGYDVKAYKSNINIRERGDFIDRSQFVQLYEVPLLSPITAQRPLASNGEHDASDYETLVTTTRFRLLTDCVTAVFDHVDRIRGFTMVPFNNEDAPQGLGASRFHVKPFLAELVGAEALDALAMSLTLDSKDAAKNVAAAIINKLRDIAFSMYIHSEYESAKMALGYTGETTVVIATDPYIRRYLQLDGELRTLSEKFNVKVVDTLDKRFRGKIFMTFVVMDGSRNEVPNILNWGNLVWGAETVISANVPRGESMSRETIVQPRYRFVEHLAVAAMVEVKNIDKVFNENFIRVKQ